MALSDKISDLQSALAEAAAVDLTFADFEKLLRVALMAPFKDGAHTVVSYSINGRSRTIGLSEARELHRYARELAKEDAADGDLVTNYAEFRDL